MILLTFNYFLLLVISYVSEKDIFESFSNLKETFPAFDDSFEKWAVLRAMCFCLQKVQDVVSVHAPLSCLYTFCFKNFELYYWWFYCFR